MNRTFRTSYLGAVYLILYLPIVILAVYSFNRSQYSVSWEGWTWQWYQQLINNEQLIGSATHSLTIATLSATAATFLGALTVMLLFRYQSRVGKAYQASLFYVLIIPDLILAISFLSLYNLLNLPLGFLTLLPAHITFSIPFVFITCRARLSHMNEHLFEAAMDLGASDFRIFTKIFLPLMKPALLASWLLCFTLSLDDVVVSYFTTGPAYQTLPLYIYSLVRVGISPEINAVCTLLLGVSVVLVATAQTVLGRE